MERKTRFIGSRADSDYMEENISDIEDIIMETEQKKRFENKKNKIK